MDKANKGQGGTRFWTISRTLFASHFLAVLLVSGSVGTFFYHSASQSLFSGLQERLKHSAALVSVKLDAGMLDTIRSEADIDTEAYRTVLHLLRDFRRTNPDVAFLYIMRMRGEAVEFVVDSDYSEDQAKPGQEYEPVLSSMLRGFHQPSADENIYEDQWGSFLSGYAPVEGGRGTYLVGIDMRANAVSEKFRELRLSGLISLGVSIILALLFSRLLANRITVPIILLISQCRAIAQGRLEHQLEHNARDEIDDLIVAFNAMSEKLAASHEHQLQAQQALREAKNSLEDMVSQRTRELQEVNRKLQLEVDEHARARDALAEAARIDPLTGLFNRRAMAELMEYQVARATRHRSPFCFLLGDIDHFKEINDRHGHAVGDRVVKEVGGLLKSSVRSEDLVARWGGEEFLILLPDTDLEGGTVLAEKIRSALMSTTFLPESLAVSVTMSIGIAVFHHGQEIDDCIRLADDAMYRAKEAGRNVIRTANGN